ncbi:PAS domain-containing sensor histidine kinase [Ferrovibrio sp.]|uniref:hybrid sensor histidine kinase/response regulator n=1 Tax=Ferrovibrio sp. TaxID=1917215 RepID=UPI000CB3C553|nr:PAS domain-containing sensor histidine kinase [Ferrovibrio sp.]PJI37540.1 MAG: hybrid sensor histidine kinase/response regulator [Ferrovibrio sp.]
MAADQPYNTALSDDRRYRLLVNSITDYAIYMLDLNGTVTSWNAGAERFKGYRADEIIGQHFSRFYSPQDREAGMPQRALETAEREGRFEAEGWRLRKDGTRFWASVVIDPVYDDSGVLTGFAKVTRDLTERMLAQEGLRRSEEQFRRLVLGVTDYAIYMLDPDGRVVSWNAGAEKIKGYSTEEIIGQHFSRFYTEDDRAQNEPERGLATAALDGRFEREGWRLRKDGTQFWAHVVIDAIRNEAGMLVGFAKVTRDMTEKLKTQQALEQAQQALFQSQKMDAIGQLTGGVAHDFNNLLMAIIGSIELLKKRVPEHPRVTPLLDNAMQGARRGAALTQRLLAFARKQELDLRSIDLPALVRGMTDLLRRTLGPSIAIETRMPDTLAAVQADANQLELALLNLTMNARDAMPNGGSIAIAAREETVAAGGPAGPLAPGRYICLSVTDTGEGMDEATLKRAAEPFFTTKGIGRGTGLGLSMVHGLAEQSGGRLVLSSRKGKGTTAELWLPLAAATATHDEAGSASDAAPSSTRPLTVLAVDDDRLVLMNTVAMLEEMGHTVLEATSGQQALEILRQHATLDLLITDEAMPQMTGLQLAKTVRAERPGLPIILATGYAEVPRESTLPKLSKPFFQEDLVRAVAAAVSR